MEYKVKSFNYVGECETWINQMSDEGWDLFDFATTAYREYIAIMEREKMNE
jgi:hypothetical protein